MAKRLYFGSLRPVERLQQHAREKKKGNGSLGSNEEVKTAANRKTERTEETIASRCSSCNRSAQPQESCCVKGRLG